MELRKALCKMLECDKKITDIKDEQDVGEVIGLELMADGTIIEKRVISDKGSELKLVGSLKNEIAFNTIKSMYETSEKENEEHVILIARTGMNRLATTFKRNSNRFAKNRTLDIRTNHIRFERYISIRVPVNYGGKLFVDELNERLVRLSKLHRR